MINSPSDFPAVGSFALYPYPHRPLFAGPAELKAVRILAILGEGGSREADISILGIPSASGRRRVALGELIDGTPLTPTEAAELDHLFHSPRARARKRGRFAALTERADHAPQLARQLDLHTRAIANARQRDQRQAAGFRGPFADQQANRAASLAEASVR